MNQNKEYIKSYEYYISKNIANLPKIDFKDISTSKPILDFACGGGHRTVEFIKLFNLQNNEIYGYDTNNEWKEIWNTNLSPINKNIFWITDLPKSFNGIIHFSHGFYMPDARDKCLDFFEKSKSNHLFVRGYDKTSIFNQVISTWDIPDNANWEEILKEKIKEKGWTYSSFRIPTTSFLSENEIENYAKMIANFVDKSGSTKVVEDLIKKNPYKNGYKIDNSDIIYHIKKLNT